MTAAGGPALAEDILAVVGRSAAGRAAAGRSAGGREGRRVPPAGASWSRCGFADCIRLTGVPQGADVQGRPATAGGLPRAGGAARQFPPVAQAPAPAAPPALFPPPLP